MGVWGNGPSGVQGQSPWPYLLKRIIAETQEQHIIIGLRRRPDALEDRAVRVRILRADLHRAVGAFLEFPPGAQRALDDARGVADAIRARTQFLLAGRV